MEDETQISESGIETSTVCDHFWVESPQQDANSNLLSVICSKCPSGINIDPEKQVIKDGIIERT